MTTVEDYQQQTEALAASSAAQVASIYAALQAVQLTRDEAAQLIAGAVNLANATATALADAYVSAQIETTAGVPTPAVGILPTDDTDRLVQAVHTILTDLDQANGPPQDRMESVAPEANPEATAVLRLKRLARAEPLETAQRAGVDTMAQQPLVEGWTRQMDADPCQLCRWWWREGRIWPKNHPFQTHKGCNCQPKVVLAESIRSTQYTRKLERNAS